MYVVTRAAAVNSSPQPPSRHLWHCTQTIDAHDSWIRSIAINRQGTYIISGSGDRSIKLWHLHNGQLHQTLQGHNGWVRALAISPDDALMVSGGNDNSVCLWQLAQGQQVATLNGHTDSVRAVAFSPDGQWIYTGSQDKTVRRWSVATGTLQNTLLTHQHWIRTLILSPMDAPWSPAPKIKKLISVMQPPVKFVVVCSSTRTILYPWPLAPMVNSLSAAALIKK